MFQRVPDSGSTRRFLTAGLCLAVTAPGCGTPDETPVEDAATVTDLYEADERLFGPYWSVEAWFLMFLPLAGYDEAGNVVGRLARSWEHSSDFRSWTIFPSGLQVPSTVHELTVAGHVQS